MLVTYSETVVAEIRAEMARQGLSQTGLAKRLDWKQQYLSRRLTGHQSLTLDELEQIALALQVSLADLGMPVQQRRSLRGARR